MRDETDKIKSKFLINNKKFKVVLTGGPGVGKTTIVNQLKGLGFDVKIEVFTELFEKANREGKLEDLLEDGSKILHDLVTLQHSLESEDNAKGITFYDRSMVDIVGFAPQINTKFSLSDEIIVNEAEYDLVFIIEPLQAEYYVQNSVRRQNYDESLKHHLKIVDAYQNYCRRKNKYINEHLILVPNIKPPLSGQLSQGKIVDSFIKARVEFILNELICFNRNF